MKKKEMEIEIDDLLVDGAGIGRTSEGQAVFVCGALPGERVWVRIVHKTKKYLIGEMEEILTPSPRRKDAPCGVFDACGGCTLQHLDYLGQLDFKWNHVKNCLKKIGGIETEVAYPLPSRNEFFYRNKAAFPVGHGDRGIKIGCYARKSHVVVDHSICMLQTPESDVCMRVIKKWAKKHFIEPYSERFHKGLLRHVVVRISNLGETMVGIVINGETLPHQEELVEELAEAIPNLASVVLNLNIQKTNVILGSRNIVLYGRDYIVQNISGLRFHISLHTFLQVNSDQTEALYANIFKMAGITKDMVVADLYCGAGTITLHAAKRAKYVYGIEIVHQAVEDARQNAELNGIKNVSFLCADCAVAFKKIQEEGKHLDVVIVDPPRKGLEQSVILDLADAAPKKIVYVSCDPATLARDLALFTEKGYEVLGVQPVDMFPQTTHIETVCLLERAKK